MIKSILVGVDASAPAAAAREHAVELARAYQARVVGVHVLDVRLLEMPPYLEYSYEGIPLIPMPTEILQGFREKGERVLEEFRRSLDGRGVAVESRLEEGIPAETIAEMGRTHDLIILGKRGEHARWGHDLLGTTTESVVRRASTPVWLAEQEVRPVRAILVMFDGSPPAGGALRLAADIATTLGATLRVLTVGDSEIQAGSVQEGARSYLDAFDLTTDYRLAAGEAVTVALEHLEAEPPDLVVMGKQGHSLIRRLILGSTSEQLMREIPGPVLLAS
ncbi:MAG TPA: universal stress protein [Thermoleophilia bacterium]|nr:universal stress protein [Thermoleophilia bacterium]